MRREKIVNRVILALLIAVLTGPVFGDSHGSPDLLILHTNDIHGRIEQGDGLLGMGKITSMMRYFHEQYEHVLLLDAGDTIHGRPIANQLDGRSVVETMNIAGYDVMVPGNHDFNYGYDRLLELEELMEFDLVAANVYKDGELLFRPWVIREVGDHRVGIFGLATPDTYQTTHPRNIEGIEFGDMEEAAQRSVDQLQSEGVDMIIALGHVGFGRNYPSTDVVEQVSGIDLFVDGHAHDLLLQGEQYRDTLFVQANEYTKYLGRVEINFTEDRPEMKASVISAAQAASEGFTPDESVEELILALRDEVRQRMLGTWQD